MTTVIDESKTLTKHMSCKCKRKFDGGNSYSNQEWNNGKCQCECKKHHTCKKVYTGNPATCSCENGKYLASTIDVSVIMCDEIIETIKTVRTNFNENKMQATSSIQLISSFFKCIMINKYNYIVQFYQF